MIKDKKRHIKVPERVYFSAWENLIFVPCETCGVETLEEDQCDSCVNNRNVITALRDEQNNRSLSFHKEALVELSEYILMGLGLTPEIGDSISSFLIKVMKRSEKEIKEKEIKEKETINNQ